MVKQLRIGMRKSPLACRQTEQVAVQLQRQGIATELKGFMTSGDRFLAPLRDIGGKGLFTKEIEEALLRNEIDCAVHSYKDMPTQLPDGLLIGAVLEREDVRDVWIGQNHTPLNELPPGSVVGTASLRRQVQLKGAFPHLTIREIRGNIQTRLEKLARGEVDGLILALAGLKRMEQMAEVTEILPINLMFPAVAQGALVLECRKDDVRTRDLIRFLNHAETDLCTVVERAFLSALDGSCRTPIGGYACVVEGALWLRGFVARPDASLFSWVDEKILLEDLMADGVDAYSFGLEQGALLLEKHQQS